MFKITEFIEDCKRGCGVTIHRRDEKDVFRCDTCKEPHELTEEINKFQYDWSTEDEKESE